MKPNPTVDAAITLANASLNWPEQVAAQSVFENALTENMRYPTVYQKALKVLADEVVRLRALLQERNDYRPT